MARTIAVLGASNTGKSTLVDRMCELEGQAHPPAGAGELRVAEFTHLVTRIKVVSAAADDAALTPDEKSRGRDLAGRLPMRALTRAWQILFKGNEETARAGNGVYAATKWGMNGWSESLRQEVLPDVRVTLIEPGVVATELPGHITHDETRTGVQQMYDQAEVTAADIAEVNAFALGRPRHLAINEILLRPAGQV